MVSKLGLAAVLLYAASAQAQIYKWVDAKGVTHYSDQAPTTGEKVETKTFGGGPTVDLPFALAEAVRTAPVTFYTTAQCDACNQARNMLQARGIPFSEKTVNTNDDIAKLKQAGSAGQLPFLVVGRAKLTGFEAGAWNAALSDASYPAERLLPSNYQYPLVESAAPPRGPSPEELARTAARAAAVLAAEEAGRKRLPPVNASPDFQF